MMDARQPMWQSAQARHQPELPQLLNSPSSFSSLVVPSESPTHSPITRFSQPELQGHFTAPVAEKLQHLRRSIKHEDQLAKSTFLASPFATQAFTGYGYTQAGLRAERNIWRRPMLQQYEVSTRRGHTCKASVFHVKPHHKKHHQFSKISVATLSHAHAFTPFEMV